MNLHGALASDLGSLSSRSSDALVHGARRWARWSAVAGFVLMVALAGCRSSGQKKHAPRPTDPDPVAAAAATQRGDWRQAADRWYAVYLEENGATVKPIAEAARAFLNLGDAENANNLVDAGLKKHTHDADLLELKGRALVMLGFRRAAEDYYSRSLQAEPRRATALLALGRLRIDLKLENAAIAPLQQYVAQVGGDYEGWALLARAMRTVGDASGSYQAWKRAFEAGPGSVEDYLTAASACLNPEVRRLNPDAYDVCRGWLEEALQQDPQCTNAHFQLGVLSEETGSYEQAVAYYRRAVETDPSCLMALTNLAILYSGRGDEPNTREMVKRALELEQNEDRRRDLQKLNEVFEKKPAPAHGS